MTAIDDRVHWIDGDQYGTVIYTYDKDDVTYWDVELDGPGVIVGLTDDQIEPE